MSTRGTDIALTAHRALIGIPSVSGNEAEAVAHMDTVLRSAGVTVERVGRNLVARTGRTPGAPRLLFNTHLDTVPPADGWTRDPYQATVEGDRVYGLGSNDAGASVAAMTGAMIDLHASGAPVELVLTLVVDEETGGAGTELVWPHLRDAGWIPDGVVVGEPTELAVATSQKGMLVARLVTEGEACHSANATALGAQNAVVELARELLAVMAVDLGPVHPDLGPTTLQPTQISGSPARNMVAGRAEAILDIRTVPGLGHDALLERLDASTNGMIEIISGRLEPYGCPAGAAIVRAACATRPASTCFGSATMSDLVFFQGVEAIKCGPGISARSHRPDEFACISEIEEGVAFYTHLAHTFAATCIPTGSTP